MMKCPGINKVSPKLHHIYGMGIITQRPLMKLGIHTANNLAISNANIDFIEIS